MKRMVKNGDLLDVEPDGSITVAGKPIGGGGSDYTAGSNINISESKEIGVKSALTGIESLKFSPDNGCFIKSGVDASLTLKGEYYPYYDHPSIFLQPSDGSSYGPIRIVFSSKQSGSKGITFTIPETGETGLNAVLVRGGRVPLLPSADGTYILKATVSSSRATYSWELQQ